MFRFSDIKIWIRLTAFISIMLVIAGAGWMIWESSVNRQTAIDQARDFSLSMHDVTMAGLTAIMFTDVPNNTFLDQIKQLSVIRDLRVIPSEHMKAGLGDNAKPKTSVMTPDATELKVLQTGKEIVEVRSDEKGSYLLAVRPTPNQKNYLGKNCTSCHSAPENSTLGVISMKISLAKVEAALSSQLFKSLLAALLIGPPLLLFIWLYDLWMAWQISRLGQAP